MPVACIQRAATPCQRVTRCTLVELAGSEAAQQVASPAVIVIGPTVPTLLGVDTDGHPDHDTATPHQPAEVRTCFGGHLDGVVSSL
jgi:siroheme synthase